MRPPVTTAAVAPPVTTTAVGVPGPGPAVTTTTIATVPDTAVVSLPGVPRMVYGSNSGQLSGGLSTTNMVQSSVTTPATTPVDPNMLANLIQSGLIPSIQRAKCSSPSHQCHSTAPVQDT